MDIVYYIFGHYFTGFITGIPCLWNGVSDFLVTNGYEYYTGLAGQPAAAIRYSPAVMLTTGSGKGEREGSDQFWPG